MDLTGLALKGKMPLGSAALPRFSAPSPYSPDVQAAVQSALGAAPDRASTGAGAAASSGRTGATGTTGDTDSTNELDKDDFLLLLITQLQNQDPLNPADGYEFVAQLAQFSSLEQQTNTNENLETIIAYQSSINTAQSLNLLNYNVKAEGNLIELINGAASEVEYYLADDAAEVTVTIYDADGEAVRTIEMGETEAGSHKLVWDGQDDNGTDQEDGSYTFRVAASDEDGDVLETLKLCQGPVTGIRFDDSGVPYLLVGSYDPEKTDENGEVIDNRIAVLVGEVYEILTPTQSGSEDDDDDSGTSSPKRPPRRSDAARALSLSDLGVPGLSSFKRQQYHPATRPTARMMAGRRL